MVLRSLAHSEFLSPYRLELTKSMNVEIVMSPSASFGTTKGSSGKNVS